MNYHTALAPALPDIEPREWWASGGSQAFVHDLYQGFPPEFLDVDVIYMDVPWADGFAEFQHRAGRVLLPPSYEEWLFALAEALINSGKPYVVVGGRASMRHLPAEWHKPVMLNGSVAVAIGARQPMPRPEIKDAATVLQWLAGNPDYNIVGDPCCGYGSAAQAFARVGKDFVATDINPECIGYIAREAGRWASSNIT